MGQGRSIQWRIMVRLLPLLALLFAGVLIWLSVLLRDTLYTANLEVAQRLNTMVLYAIGSSMNTDKSHEEWMRVAERISTIPGTELEVVTCSGEVLYSQDPDRQGRMLEPDSAACSACHAAGASRPTRVATKIVDPGGSAHQLFATTLENTDECRECHQDAGQSLGVVLVRQSLEPVNRQIRIMQAGVAAAGIIALLVSILVTRLLIGRFLDRPLGKLVSGAEEIGAGNLTHTIEPIDSPELDVLARTINESTERLARMQEESVRQERLAAVGETVAGLAHCLKNTLNGLRAGQYVIERAAQEKDNKKLYKGWDVMKGAVLQVERLTFDMLYFITQRVPDREPTDPNEVVQEVVEVMHQSASDRGVDLRTELDEEIGRELLDHNTIYRAVLNLVTNAIDACVESETGDLVVVRTQAGPEEISISVEDNGTGIPEEIRARLFTQFFSTKPSSGTGLGLHVVKKIVEEHGGRLELESTPGRGTVFHVHLPRTRTGGRAGPVERREDASPERVKMTRFNG